MAKIARSVLITVTLFMMVPKLAPAQEPAAPVDCAWLCHCARQIGDCDAKETKWDVCLDTAQTVHPEKVESCDRCRQIAEEACGRRTCPPSGGPKFLFQHFCDRRPQELAAATPLGDLLATSPSIALSGTLAAAETSAAPKKEEMAVEVEPVVKCTYFCGCSAGTGMCDEKEKRSRACFDKVESTLARRDCIACIAAANLDCWARVCPLAAGTTKTMSNFKCPVP